MRQELKDFAKNIGVKAVTKLRKDELEEIIKKYILSGKISQKIIKKDINSKVKDYENSQLTLETMIINYCNDKTTKAFILDEAKKIQENIPKKSGVWYWLNRWREDNIDNQITYGDLINKFLDLSNKKERLPQIPSTKMNNFISDFIEAKEGGKKEALEIWEKLKKMDISKTYESWKKFNLKGK